MAPRWLEHPLTRGLDLDDPRTTLLRREILARKRFLRRLYREWYAGLAAQLPSGVGPVLEVGSGAGCLPELLPGVLTSDVFPLSGVDCALDAMKLPFADGVFRGVLGTNVLHHLARPRQFLAETARCVRPGGVLALLEPWVTRWSRLVFSHLHHEPFDPDAVSWDLPPGGPLSGANGALPWLMFERDRERFERELPFWKIRSIRTTTPLRYLLSGGLSLRVSMPAWSFPHWSLVERALRPWNRHLAMFARIVLERTAVDP